MEGTSSVLFARPDRESELLTAIERYMQAIATDPTLVYADLHATKHPNKFVLVEMYRDAAARVSQRDTEHGRAWTEATGSLLTAECLFERIRPVMSHSPRYARPNTDHEAQRPAAIVCSIAGDAEPFGAFVRVFPRAATEAEFMPILIRQGEIVAAQEPGFLFADFYRFDESECMLVVEYYDDRRSLSHHHTLEHTLEFAERKAAADYEVRKHEAFTVRPGKSVGPFARTFKKDPSKRVLAPAQAVDA
jgi:quinol monooxygenase YgiN